MRGLRRSMANTLRSRRVVCGFAGVPVGQVSSSRYRTDWTRPHNIRFRIGRRQNRPPFGRRSRSPVRSCKGRWCRNRRALRSRIHNLRRRTPGPRRSKQRRHSPNHDSHNRGRSHNPSHRATCLRRYPTGQHRHPAENRDPKPKPPRHLPTPIPARPTPTPGRKPRPEPTRPTPTPGRPRPIRAGIPHLR